MWFQSPGGWCHPEAFIILMSETLAEAVWEDAYKRGLLTARQLGSESKHQVSQALPVATALYLAPSHKVSRSAIPASPV